MQRKLRLGVIAGCCLLAGNSLAQLPETAERRNPNVPHLSGQQGDMICLLSGPELQKRKASLQKEIFAKMIRSAEKETGFIFYFRDEGDFVHVLMDYVLAEKMCCPFLQYDLQILSHGEGLSLGVSGPGEVKEFLKNMLESDG